MNVEHHTFSIAGRCARTGAFGVAVSTARPAVGAAVPWAGPDCKPWCGHRVESGFTVAGNFLTGPDVLAAMATAFVADESAELGERLLRALEAGQAAGGDQRGRQSAALLVWSPEVRPHHNLRVDDHADPVVELRRIFTVMHGFLETLREDYGEGLGIYRRPKL